MMPNPLVSCILASYLYPYEGAAKNRNEKLMRAINSFIKQSYTNTELILISDGCPKTESIYNNNFKDHPKIKFKYILRDGLFSGKPRSEGLKLANGKIIIYLDVDDYFTPSHISNVVSGFIQSEGHEPDWVYYNDYIKINKHNSTPRNVEICFGSIGTSSIAHKKSLEVNWEGCNGYGHDWTFIQRLSKVSGNRKKIYGCGYVVCHIAGVIDL